MSNNVKITKSLRLESITEDRTRSFSLLFNPRLSDLYFWHYHPEYELVYIEAEKGQRRIGADVSLFQQSDMVLIGSDIPHLNFDYGITTDYRKVVLHLKKELVEDQLMQVPEISNVGDLFEESKQVVVFDQSLHKDIGRRLFALEGIPLAQQYLKIIEVLQYLADDSNRTTIYKQPFNIEVNNKEKGRINMIHRYIDDHYREAISLSEISALVNMSRGAFCRYFKQTTGYTFVQFLNRYRISQAKLLLKEGRTVSESCYASGFESLSYFNRVFNQVTGMGPREFLK